MDYKKNLIPGIVAAVVLVVLGFVMSMIYPASTAWYMEAFASMNMTMMWLGTALVGIFMGLFYGVVGKAIPGKGLRKGINYGLMIWLFAGVMWPVMAIGWAPLNITIFDLVGGAVTYALTGAAIAKVSK